MPLKFLILLLFIAANGIGQGTCPVNIGFEKGDFTNWDCYAGKIDGAGNINVNLTPPQGGRHTMIQNTYPQALDPYGGFPVNCPNGSGYSIQLGNSSSGAQAERVSYTFTVPINQSEYSIIYNYAVVFQNPPHSSYEQPKFTANVFDATSNTYIGCSSFEFIAAANLPGFQLSPRDPTVFYKSWSPITLNLSGYAGKTIRLEFTTNDCTRGGHFGYAYLDVNENCSSPISGNVYCNGATSVTLTAPYGFKDYHWYDVAKNLLGTSNTLKIAPPPPPNTIYSVDIDPYPGQGCPLTLYTSINLSPDAFDMHVVDSVSSCVASGFDLTSSAITIGSTPDLIYSYFLDPGLLNYMPTPKFITKSGVYYIKGVNKAGCNDSRPINVTINQPKAVAKDPVAVCDPDKINLTDPALVAGSDAGLKFTYWKDIFATVSLPNPSAINLSGIYYIKASDSIGCSIILPVSARVSILPALTVQNTVMACGQVDITSADVIKANPSDFTFGYYADAGATSTLPNPKAITISGNYYIKASSFVGCSVIKPVNVKVNPYPVINITDPLPVIRPATIDITALFAQYPAVIYSYWLNAATNKVLPDPTAVDIGGTYYIKAIDSLGCTDTASVRLVMKDPDIIPTNAFTPNDDGINDTWSIPLIRLFPQCVVDVYNRYGQVVFHSYGYSKPWDGKVNGKSLPVATYYYVIKLSSLHPPVSGTVTILK